jgi:pseudouridine synthase
MSKERLQKVLAQAGYGSRRACERLIKAGRVTVEGRVATLGDKADPTKQTIAVDGVRMKYEPPTYVYVMLNKPRGVISTVSDPRGRRTVLDLVPSEERLYPVGRLDANSEGLILLTNDGALTQRLTHPKFEHPRVYRVRVAGEVEQETLERWRKGITLEGKHTRVDAVQIDSKEGDDTWLRFTVHEGRKHLIRRLVAALGHPAKSLIRVEMGPIKLGNLPPGRWRHLRSHEVAALQALTEPSRKRKGRGRRPSSRRKKR